MVRVMIECPKTGLPVRTNIPFTTLAREPATLVSVHCTRCGELHRFCYTDACIEISAPRRALTRA
jgi:RNase P subunit RPR2